MHCSKYVSFWGTSYSTPPIAHTSLPPLQNPGGATAYRLYGRVGNNRVAQRQNKQASRRLRADPVIGAAHTNQLAK